MHTKSLRQTTSTNWLYVVTHRQYNGKQLYIIYVVCSQCLYVQYITVTTSCMYVDGNTAITQYYNSYPVPYQVPSLIISYIYVHSYVLYLRILHRVKHIQCTYVYNYKHYKPRTYVY